MSFRDNGDGTFTFSLARPVKLGEKEYASITIKGEATAYDLEAMDECAGQVGQTQRLIARLTEISAERPGLKLAVIRKLVAADYMQIAKGVGKILGGGRPDDEDEGADDEGKAEARES